MSACFLEAIGNAPVFSADTLGKYSVKGRSSLNIYPNTDT